MRIALAADHKGVEMKRRVSAMLSSWGHIVEDFGTNTSESVDYPDYGLAAARAVAKGQADRAITVCWTGNGMNIGANKVRGIRAGMALNPEMAKLTRLHNDANVLTLSAKFTDEDTLDQTIKNFLDTEFEGGRHIPRVAKVMAAEKDCC